MGVVQAAFSQKKLKIFVIVEDLMEDMDPAAIGLGGL